MPVSERTDPGAPDGALVRSAKVARALALEHCLHAIGGDCTWYHGVWQYLRALGFVKRAGGQVDFFRDTLRQLALIDRARRVLISGSADDAMSLIALEAFRDPRVSPELTVMDRCEAPLALSRWSAAQAGASVASQRADIIEFAPVALYDVIATSGFLSYFEPAARPRLFARWASLLRPGGKLLFTNRIRPAAVAGPPAGFTPDEARALAAAVRARAERHRNALALDPAELEQWTLDYATRIKTFPVKSVDEILALLREAGFAPDYVDTAVFPGTLGGVAVAGPTAADRSAFVRVIATRSADSHG